MRRAWERKRRTIRRYDTTAETYDGLYAEEQRRKYALLGWSALLKDGRSVLDVGCGSGLLLEKLSSMAGLLVGVDASRRMIFKAKRRVGAHGNVDLVLADSDFLPFRDGVFSCVLSFTLLQNVPNPLTTVKEIVRAAQSDSVLVISTLKEARPGESLRNLLLAAGLSEMNVLDEGAKDFVVVCKRSV